MGDGDVNSYIKSPLSFSHRIDDDVESAFDNVTRGAEELRKAEQK